MRKRSLMLAGGGVKVAFQAGVLQVWLDDAGIEFDHADAVSANLAIRPHAKEATTTSRSVRPIYSRVSTDGAEARDGVRSLIWAGAL